MHIKYLQIGERTITTPIGYRKKVVLSKKGKTTTTDVNQLINLMLFNNSHQLYQNLPIQSYTFSFQRDFRKTPETILGANMQESKITDPSKV